MKCSVVITNYNKEIWLRKCLESALGQTHGEFEILIVDDASTDSSGGIIQEYAMNDNRIVFHRFPENRGMAAAYNFLIPKASGEIVCLLDSDDFWYEGKLEMVSRFFDQNPEAVMHQHNLELYRRTEKTGEKFRKFFLSGDLVSFVENTKAIPVFIPTTGLSFRREALQKVLPVPLSFHTTGEGFLTRTVMCHGLVGATDELYGGYRATGDNAWFENAKFDGTDYVSRVMVPSLNRYYAENGIELRLPEGKRLGWKNKVLDLSPRKILQRVGLLRSNH